MCHRKNAHNKRAYSESEHVVFGPYRHKEKRKKALKEKAGTKPKSDDSISTVLEEDEELGGSTGLNEDGLQSLLDNVEDLLDDDAEDAAAQRERASTVRNNDKVIGTVMPRSVQKQLEELNAPRELQQATALLLQSTLLDEDTARMLTNDILDQPAESDNAEVKEEGHGIDDCIRRDEESAQSREVGSTAENHATIANDTTTAEGEEELQPSESTSLLSVSTENDDMLRPSIFTMHSGSLNSMSPPDR